MKKYDVVIIGGGSGGMGSAYALKKGGYSVAVIEQENSLGGTACNAWVETWIQGLIPPHIEKIFSQLGNHEKKGELERSWIPPRFSKDGGDEEDSIIMLHEPLSKKYYNDLSGKVDILLNHELVAVKEKDGRYVRSIVVLDKKNNVKKSLSATFFIDASADGVLCRLAGNNYFYGRDKYSIYKESIAAKDTTHCKECINEPSLFFRIKIKGKEEKEGKDYDNCTTVRYDNATKKVVAPPYINGDGYPSYFWVNPMTGFDTPGKPDGIPPVIKQGILPTFLIYKKRVIEYWKFIKLNLEYLPKENKRFRAWAKAYKNYIYTDEHASYLGVRESYRIEADRMLTQNDLSEKISSKNLERYIAVGTHIIDFHVSFGLDTEELKRFNKEDLRPYGIPYDCLIPKIFNNILIASRCFGASQIALASARTNMLMAQLGWAAGNAIRICLEESLNDVRDVSISKLQDSKLSKDNSEYTEFYSRVLKLESKMKNI